jgi:DNA-binding NarL/FixJ family response regulator
MNKINILLVDDHNLIIEGIRSSLKNHETIKVVAFANNSKETFHQLQNFKIDVILLDINLQNENGIQLCAEIKKAYKDIKIIALSNYSKKSFIDDMIQNGANGYLLKNVEKHDLIKAIERVAQGKSYFSDDIQELLFYKNQTSNLNITKREKEILILISEGITSNQIADKLCISPLTADTHRKNLLLKLEASNTAQLIKKATQLGFLD